MAFRPELLVLDEPSSGLDPVVRRDILGAIIRTITDDGRTVLFSSHLLDEVERVSDHVAMIDRGRVVVNGSLDSVRSQHHLVIIRTDIPHADTPSIASAIAVEGSGRDWSAICTGDFAAIFEDVARISGEVVESREATLDEIFVARIASHRSKPQAQMEVAIP